MDPTGNRQSFYNNSIFWVEVSRISPNPYQPRKEFDEARLNELADSIRQYGVLQPLVVTRHEEAGEGGLLVTYELIAGERRLRASKIAGLSQVPVLIRSGEETNRVKLELAIIENLQREDLNPIDRGKAFKQLVDEFKYKQAEIGRKIGKSREFVSNSIRLLSLSEEVQDALRDKKINEGHTRPLLMLADRPEEQTTLFKEIMYKKLTVREAEGIARRIAVDKARKRRELNPDLVELERKLTETLGTRVQIEEREQGGKITIDYFSPGDLESIITLLEKAKNDDGESMLDRFLATMSKRGNEERTEESPSDISAEDTESREKNDEKVEASTAPSSKDANDDELYSVKNFTI
jgi:ParB family chromosome partitioning protein